VATFVPPKRGAALTTYAALVSQATRPQFQVNPTLAAGDVKVSKDGGAFNNITTLPTVTPAAGAQVKIDLSAAEMTADVVTVLFSDAAGTEWDDMLLVIPTAARQIDDLAFPNISGRGVDVDATGGVEITVDQSVNVNKWGGAAPNALVAGRVDSSVGAMAAGVVTAAAVATDAIDADALAADAVTEIGTGVWATVARTLTASLDPTAAQIRAEIDANSVGLAAIFARTDVATSSRAAPGDAMALSAAAVDTIWDEVLESGKTGRELMRLFAAALLGKVSGLDVNTPAFRDLADTKNRISATTDASGNRSAVILDAA
jgi:hypothetical protein